MFSLGNIKPKALGICNIESKMDVILERRLPLLTRMGNDKSIRINNAAVSVNWYKKIGRENYTKFLQLMYSSYFDNDGYLTNRFSIKELQKIYMYEKWNKMKPSLYTLMQCNKNPKNKNYLPNEIIVNIGSYLKMGNKNPRNKIWEDEEDKMYDAFFKDMLDYKDLINSKEKRLRKMEDKFKEDMGKFPSLEWELMKAALKDRGIKRLMEERDRKRIARTERIAQMKKYFFETKLVVEYMIAQLSKRDGGQINMDDITTIILKE